ncbi:MAG: tetratricopeptide repeat protein [Bacteroidetes bacterium]|nr:tetratricopeptide repeat protein [Bacteroidota bacterium]MCL5025803.1 tetratricopeptide repeat protein [Chloroflexota bacterium]
MTQLGRFYERVVEMGWLMAIAATPIYFNIYSSRVFEPDKATILRSVAVFTAAAFLLAQLERRGGQSAAGDDQQGGLHRPLMVSALALAGVQILATITSIAPPISWWGSYMRLQGAYTFLAYFTLFLIMLASLRRREQVDRLITVALLVSAPISLYGIVQFLHKDPLPWGGDVAARVTSSLGNAIFLAAYLIMVVPLTLTRWVESLRRWQRTPPPTAAAWEASVPSLLGRVGLVLLMNLFPAFLLILNGRSPNVWWGALPALASFVVLCLPFTRQSKPLPPLVGVLSYGLLSALQVLAIFLTQSRGPWIGLAAGLVCFVALLALRGRRRQLLKGAVGVAIPLALLLVIVNLPIPQLDSFRQLPYVGRLGTLTELESGTGKVRSLIWQGSLELLRERPAPGLQPDALAALRPLVGYGPDVMALASNKVYQPGLAQLEARNASPDRNHLNLLDHLIMTGALGLAAYLAIVVLGLRLAWVYLWKADQWHSQLVLIGIISGLAAHLVESQVGIVIVATWTYFWMYLAIIARTPAWTAEPALAGVAQAVALQPAPATVIASGRRRKGRRTPTGTEPEPAALASTSNDIFSPWYWPASYVGLSIFGVILLLAARPIEDASLLYALSYAWAVVGILVGGITMSGTTASLRRALPAWSGGWVPVLAPVLLLLVLTPITLKNLSVVTADVYYKRGTGAEAMGRMDLAVLNYQKALLLEPDQDWYYIFFGRTLLTLAEQRPPQAANPASAASVPLAADQILTLDARAVSAMPREELLGATHALFDRARQLNPLNPDHYANLGRLYRFWGETADRKYLDDSVRLLDEAITVSPRSTLLRNDLARTYMSRGEFDQALKVLEESRQLDPTFASTYALLGYAYQELQMWDQALASHDRALEIDPSSLMESGAEQRIVKYIEAGKGEELAQILRRAAEKHPTSTVVHSTYGFVLSRLGKTQEALDQYRINVELAPKDWVGHRNMAISYQQLGMLPEALASAQLALQYAPDNQKKPMQDFVASIQAAARPHN